MVISFSFLVITLLPSEIRTTALGLLWERYFHGVHCEVGVKGFSMWRGGRVLDNCLELCCGLPELLREWGCGDVRQEREAWRTG